MGLDHEQLTYRYSGRDYRLTDVHGNVVQDIIRGAFSSAARLRHARQFCQPITRCRPLKAALGPHPSSWTRHPSSSFRYRSQPALRG